MNRFKPLIEFIKELYPGKDFIPLHEPSFNGNEKKYVADTIESTFVSSVGEYVDRFEAMIRDYTGAKYAIAVVNGTAALHMSLLLSGVKQGDLVITQALSFVATCNAISYLGAEPAFIDVDIDSIGMSPDSLKSFLNRVKCINGSAIHIPTGKKIAACVPMHTLGIPCKIDQITAICAEYGIPVVEDAAESMGSVYKGKHTGTFGLLGTYSFNGNKIITCGGGGMIITNDDRLGKMAKHLTTQAKIAHRWEFNHDHIGYNYRCPNLNAALACAQLEQLESFIDIKRHTASLYHSFFTANRFNFIKEPVESRSNYWLNAVYLNTKDERDLFLEETNNNGIMTRPVWTLMHRLPMFNYCQHDSLKNSLELEAKLVNIPSSVRS